MSGAAREGMILIPAGPFTMGSDEFDIEGPVRTLTLPAFWIDRYPVTNAAYEAFVRATGHRAPADRHGALHRRRDDLGTWKAAYAERTNPSNVAGTADQALAGADVFIGLSGPGAVTREGIAAMNEGAIVFAMANPIPEVMPEEIAGLAAVIATGRSDYPNQINNVLAFPGVFRGALDVRASAINEQMKLAAAEAIASVVRPVDLSAEYIIPSVFNRDVAPFLHPGQ